MTSKQEKNRKRKARNYRRDYVSKDSKLHQKRIKASSEKGSTNK